MENEVIAQLQTTVRELQVQVIASRLLLEALLGSASAQVVAEIGHMAMSAPQIALHHPFSDEQIEQLQQQLSQSHQSALKELMRRG